MEIQNIATLAQINSITISSNENSNVTTSQEELDEIQGQIDNLKKDYENTIDALISNKLVSKGKNNSTNKNSENEEEEEEEEKPILLINDLFIAKIQKGNKNKNKKFRILNSKDSNNNNNNSENNDNQKDLKGKLASVDSTKCEKILQKEYNITKSLLIKSVQFDKNVNLKNIKDSTASDSLKLQYFNPENGEMLNSTKCEKVKLPFSLPIRNIKRVKKDLYDRAKKEIKGIDLYNKAAPSYHSRCFTSKDFETGGDTSIIFRRTKLYQNESMNCSPSCEYNGIDENNATVCDCKAGKDEEISSNSTGFDSFMAIPHFNYDIVFCYYEGFVEVFKFFFLFFSFFFLFLLIFYRTTYQKISDYI